MEIYLIRHGQSEANRSRTVQGTMDSPLTELGRKQATQLISIIPDDLDHIYTSTLSRAIETGLIATKADHDNKFTKFRELEEICFGDLQGRPYESTGYELNIIKRHVRFEVDILCGNHDAETIDSFFERTHRIFDHIVGEMVENNWNKVAIFTHGGVLRSVLQYHLELTSDRFENCEVAYLKLDEQDNWNLERFNDHIIFE